MPLVKLPFSGGAFQSVDDFELSNSPNSPRLVNFLLNDAGSNISRPALESFASINDKVIGLTAFKNKLIGVNDNRDVYSTDPSSAVATDVTGIKLPGSDRPVFAQDGEILVIAGGDQIIKYAGSGTTEFLEGSPPRASHIVFLDGYFIANEVGSGRFRIAGPTGLTRLVWDPLDVTTAEGLPDNIVSMGVSERNLFLLGTNSTEVFNNFGDAITPFQRIAFIDTGTSAPYSLVNAINTIWYLDDARRFVKIENRFPRIISGPFDRILQQMTTVDDCYGRVIEIESQYIIVWTFPTEQKTFWYSYKNEQWGEFAGFSGGKETRFNYNAYAYEPSTNTHFTGAFSSGQLSKFKFGVFQDNGEHLFRLRRSAPIDHGSSVRKRSKLLRIRGKRGGGVSLTTTPEPVLSMRYRDEMGPWSDWQTSGLGRVGDPNPQIEFYNLGIYRSRQWEIAVTDDIGFTVQNLEEDIDIMVS